MLDDRPIYVVDTNVVIDYPDIIADHKDGQPEESTVDLSHAHIVIPETVVEELESFKKETSDRGEAARAALKRIREIDAHEADGVGASYRLQHSTPIPNSDQLLSVLPVHKNFKQALPFCPSEDDMDGQIILAALTVIYLKEGRPIDGTWSGVLRHDSTNVTLLTNDNGLAIRARERGVKTERYGYKYPEPYTGRRDVIVPSALFSKFLWERRIELEEWEEYMPDQPELVANEFIVMDLANPIDYPSDFNPVYNPGFDHIGRYDATEGAIVPLEHVRAFSEIAPLRNAGQAIYAEALMSDKFSAVICVGPAGSGKTFMATVYGYWACQKGKYIGVTVVPCDSRSKLGALPGDLDEKMDPDVQPIKNALRNYLLSENRKHRKDLETLRRHGTSDETSSEDSNSNGRRPKRASCEEPSAKKSIKARVEDHASLIYSNWFSNIPIEHARGRDFAYELAIYDEFQDQTFSQADTLIKRLGTDGKIVITGDTEQIHAPYIDASSNGLVYASRQLMGSEMVAQVCFTEEEVIRHPLVKMVAMRQKSKKARRAE